MRNGQLIAGAAVISLIFICGQTETQVLDRLVVPYEKLYGHRFWEHSPSERFGDAWTKGLLDAPSKLRQREARLDKRFEASWDTEGFVRSMRAQAMANPTSPESLFDWAYAATKEVAVESQRGKAYWDGRDRLREHGLLVWLLAAAKQPHDPEYVRIRFLSEGAQGAWPYLCPLGRRLIAEHKNDDAVRRTLALQLGMSHKKADLDESVRLCDNLLAREPHNLHNLGIRGFVYISRWMSLKHQRSDGLHAIADFQHYIDMAPKDCPNSIWMKQYIEITRSEMAGKDR